MALTKVTGQVIKNTTDVTVGVLTVTNNLSVDAALSVGATATFVSDVSIGGTVSIAGTLTYEDVTNIDAVGLITARNGIVVGSGITLSKDGDIFATGVTTSTTFVGNLTGNADTATNSTNSSHILVTDNENTNENNLITFVEDATSSTGNVGLEMDGNLTYNPSTGTVSATAFSGDGSALTGIGGTDFIHAEQINTTGIVTASTFVPTAGQFFAERNKLINGAFRIFQRGDVVSTTDKELEDLGAGGTFTADHWGLYCQNTNSRYKVRRVNGDHPDGFGQSLKITCTTADTSLASNEEVYLYQKIEGFDTQDFAKGTSSAKQYTLSFYAKSTKTGTYIVRLLGRHNTNRCVSASYTISDTNWNRYVVTFPADTSIVDNPDATEALRVKWWLVAGSAVNSGSLQTTWINSTDTGAATGQLNFADSTSNIIYFAGCQLEVGDVATPFEYRKFTRDLHDCYRYYRRWRAGVDGVTSAADGSTFTATTLAKGDALDSDDAAVELDLIPPMNHKPAVETFTALRLAQGQNIVDNTTTVQENYSSLAKLRLHIDNAGSVNVSYDQRLVMKDGTGDFAIEAEL